MKRTIADVIILVAEIISFAVIPIVLTFAAYLAFTDTFLFLILLGISASYLMGVALYTWAKDVDAN